MLLLASSALVAAISGCPKPVHHIKHKADAPLCSCWIEPKTITLVADPEPEVVTVVTYYVPLTSEQIYYPQPLENWDTYFGPYGYTYTIHEVPRQCPEIGADSAAASLMLLFGGLLVIRGRKHV